MRMSKEQLKSHLAECYKYHLKKSMALRMDKSVSTEDAYELGKHDGALNMVGAIMLLCFGGEETFNLWQECRDQVEEDPDER